MSDTHHVSAVCCGVSRSVLQCVAVCCSVLQCVAVCLAVCCSVHAVCSREKHIDFSWRIDSATPALASIIPLIGLQCVAVCCSVLRCVAVCCGVLQCVAVCCGVLRGGAVW